MSQLALLQAAAPPAWVGPTMAISLGIIAAAFLLMALVLAVVALRLTGELRRLRPFIEKAQEDVQRTTATVRDLLAEGQDLVAVARREAGALSQTSRRLRRKVLRGADRIEERLNDLEALYDVMYAEVTDTSLDVAAAMRNVRQGNGMLGRLRSALVPGDR
jgi:HAMP domain-containing protein